MSSRERESPPFACWSSCLICLDTVESLQNGAGESWCLFAALCHRGRETDYSAVKRNVSAISSGFLHVLVVAGSR